MKILILKPSSLGDVVQALPVLRLLKLHLPSSQIYWWIQSQLAPLLENDPDLAGIIPFERHHWHWPRRWVNGWEHLRFMRRMRFDWVLDLQALLRSGAVGWLANGSLTIGLDDSREGARGFYDIIVPRRSFLTHAVDWYLDVLRHLDVPVHNHFVWLQNYPQAAALVRQQAQPGRRWVVLQPGARWNNKCWPAEYFAELVQRFAVRQADVHFAILGSSADRPLGKLIAAACPTRCLDLTGQTSLTELVEWLRASEVVVTNDTGPMHLAAALGKPMVALFGPTEPRRTGPYGQLEQVLQASLRCVPCLKDTCAFEKPLECLRGLGPGLVSARLESLLETAK